MTQDRWTHDEIKACVGPGWGPILDRLVDRLEALGWDGYVSDVKEKFGGLRFYVGHETREMSLAISEAEAEAWKTCEECGAPGVLRAGGWLKTRCDAHAGGRGPWRPKGEL